MVLAKYNLNLLRFFLPCLLGILVQTSVASELDGIYAQIGLGGAGTATNVSGATGMSPSVSQYDYRNTQGGFNGLVSVGYSKEVPNAGGFNLAANVFYLIGQQNAGDGGKSSSWSEGSEQWFESSSSVRKLQNTFGISVEPGINFNETTLGYFKLAWVQSRQNVVDSYFLTDPSIGVSGVLAEFNQTRTVNGFGYGLGLKKMLGDNVFLGIDAMGVSYNQVSYGGNGSIKSQPSQVMGFASIGYKF